jgi:hypothetical protein
VLDKFKLKFLKARVQLNDLVQAETGSNGEDHNKLPAKIASELNKTLAGLPSYPPYLEAIQNALQTALQKWRDDIDAPNSLVILGSPVLPLSEIINDAIANWEGKELLEVRSISLSARPHEFNQIQSLLEKQLPTHSDSSDNADVTDSAEVLDSRKTLMVIPRLDWCFLRCIEGLEPIEDLRNLVFKSHSVFWLIGCNNWAWRYLDFIFQVSAYFGQTVGLPNAKGDELQRWFNPLLEQINLEVSEELTPEKISESQELYFETLAENSLGISSVAADLWLRSLRYETVSESQDSEAKSPSDFSPPFKLQQNKPKLPDLPSLIPEDRYILYSLLLHGGMSLFQLALSLGEAESPVKARVQFLVQSDIIDRYKNLLVVNPAYYPRLKTLLYSNNFLVGD